MTLQIVAAFLVTTVLAALFGIRRVLIAAGVLVLANLVYVEFFFDGFGPN